MHPQLPTEAFTLNDFIEWAHAHEHDAVYATHLWEESCPVANAQLGEDELDENAVPYSYMGFFAFTKDVAKADKMWIESKRYNPHGTMDYGNWSGVHTRPLTRQLIAEPFSSAFEENSHMPRSLSQGHLSEMGRSTLRHEHGHPTAVGQAWLAAT